MEGFCERALHRLQERKNKIQDLTDAIHGFQQKEKSYTSDAFIKIFRDVQDQLLPHLDKPEKKEVELVFKEGNVLIAQDFEEDTLKMFDITDEHETLLKTWIGGDEKAPALKFELLYRATRDTFSSIKMHEMINNKGPIVAILKSQHDKVFGGYSSIGWKPDGAWTADEKAFIFSLSHKTQHLQY